MKLVVFSHKPCWPSASSPSGYATDGGFPFQMQALAELFDETRLVLPYTGNGNRLGELPLCGHVMTIVPLSIRSGQGFSSKLSFFPWLLLNLRTLLRELRAADAVHAPIPGDVGTVGMLLAWLWRKPLFVRHCGNWLRPTTVAEKFWRWFMERTAGGRNVMLATGGTEAPPSIRNAKVRWIFATSLNQLELSAYGCPRRCPFRPSAGVSSTLEKVCGRMTAGGRPGEAGKPLRLVIVARQESAKGAGIVIRALPLLAQRFPGVRLQIVGDGSAIPTFKQMAASLGVVERVEFTGKLNHEQVMKQLQAAHLFVFPTTSSDGFPKAVLEALASGLPVVATRVSVLPQLLGNGCGVLIDDATPQAVTLGIEQALESSAHYEGMSNRATEAARAYSLEAWRDSIGEHLTAAWGTLATHRAQAPAAMVKEQKPGAGGTTVF